MRMSTHPGNTTIVISDRSNYIYKMYLVINTMGVIYCIENMINGKKYVGQTKRTVKTRWTEHINKKSRCWFLGRAIQKHGTSNFKFSIIVYCF